jgi:nucleotide-binding universal stress UspA family protein
MGSDRVATEFIILLADDGSAHSRAAVDLITDISFPETSEIHVLRVITPLQAAEHSLFESSLEETRSALASQGLNAKAELLLGYPAEKIIEYSEQLRPELIVLGAKGLRSTLGILLGGVAQQVVEYACCPVLIVRAPFNGLSRILIATDGSESSLAAVNFFETLPKKKEAVIDVIHVLPPPPIPMSVVEPMFVDLAISQPWEITEEESERRKKEEEIGEELLLRIKGSLKSVGYESTPILKRGDAASEIIEYVKSNDVDLIVTGSRGFGNIRSWLMGSVSRKLVHYSDCSVLVVRGDH